MQRLCISLAKGGTGKTTTAVNLSAGLAEAGYKTLIVDTDTQGHVASHLGLTSKPGLAEVMKQEATFDQAIIEARDNLFILAGSRSLAGIQRMIAQKEFGGEITLTESLEPIEGQYDYIVFDTSPGWNTMTVNVLFYVTDVLAPVNLEVLALKGVVELRQSLAQIQRYREKLTLRYVLPTFLDRRVKKSEEILEQLNTHFDDELCPPIRYNVRLSEAPGFGQTIFEYAPRSKGANDYKQLTERIIANGSA